MTPRGITSIELCDALGCEIRRLDLRRPLAPEERAELRDLFDSYHLLLFREQAMSAEDQLRVCAYLRPVVDPVAWVSNVEPGFHPEGQLLFHSDYAFTPNPMLGLSLYAIEVAPGAAPTLFASNARAIAVLPDTVREQLQRLNVVHMIDSVNGRENVRTRMRDVGGPSAPTDVYPRFSRPAVFPHPVTGQPLLFVLEQQASHFDGWTCEDSDELLDAAFACLYDPSNVYSHDWKVGDFIVWDNLALQHGRPANPNTVRRSLRRVAMNTITTVQLIEGTGFGASVRSRYGAAAVAAGD